MLVAVEADAVTQAMGEEFVVRAVAGARDYRAGGVVHGSGKAAGTGRVQGGVLRLAHDLEGAARFSRDGLPKTEVRVTSDS